MDRKPENNGTDMTGFRDPDPVRAGLNRLAEHDQHAHTRNNAGYNGDGGVSYGENQRIDQTIHSTLPCLRDERLTLA